MKTEKSTLRVGAKASWADEDAMQTNFGVTSKESKASVKSASLAQWA